MFFVKLASLVCVCKGSEVRIIDAFLIKNFSLVVVEILGLTFLET
jgi:hypothetical protein